MHRPLCPASLTCCGLIYPVMFGCKQVVYKKDGADKREDAHADTLQYLLCPHVAID